MLPAMFRNTWFPTVFDDFDFTPRANTTAPAVNVMENETAYTMEVAAPGIKKEFCRVNINEDGNLCVAIENKWEHKEEDKEKKQHYLRREFSYGPSLPRWYSRCVTTWLMKEICTIFICRRMWIKSTFLQR